MPHIIKHIHDTLNNNTNWILNAKERTPQIVDSIKSSADNPNPVLCRVMKQTTRPISTQELFVNNTRLKQTTDTVYQWKGSDVNTFPILYLLYGNLYWYLYFAKRFYFNSCWFRIYYRVVYGLTISNYYNTRMQWFELKDV